MNLIEKNTDARIVEILETQLQEQKGGGEFKPEKAPNQPFRVFPKNR